MPKDQLARGARSASYGNAGIGESPLMLKVREEEEAGAADLQVDDVPVIERPKRPLKKFIPAGKTILVRQAAVEGDEHRFTDLGSALKAQTPGVVIVEKDEDKKADAPAEGTVLAVGPDAVTVSVGDYVVFGKYAGAAFNLNGEWLLLMEAKEVLGTLKTQDIDDEVEETYVAEFVDEPSALNSFTRTIAEA
jgi:co-chaperonin GroES (HSP10)